MRVIVGLGNPEGEYKNTRHNIGFETVNKLSFDYGIPVRKYRSAFRAYTGEGAISGVSVLLVKPMTYMNLSGEAAAAVLRFYKQPPSALIVVCDDVALPVGDIRVRAQGSAGGQKGLKNIIDRLGTEQFTRVRAGIGGKPEGWSLTDYVLSRFTKEETEAMIEGVQRAGDAVALILREGVETAMNRFNRKRAQTDTEEA